MSYVPLQHGKTVSLLPNLAGNISTVSKLFEPSSVYIIYTQYLHNFLLKVISVNWYKLKANFIVFKYIIQCKLINLRFQTVIYQFNSFQYYSELGLSDKEKKERMKKCSRHRGKFTPPATPDHFWELEFPDTQECKARGQLNVLFKFPIGQRLPCKYIFC